MWAAADSLVDVVVDFFCFWKKKVTRLLGIFFLGLEIDVSLSEQEEIDNGLFLLVSSTILCIVVSLLLVGSKLSGDVTPLSVAELSVRVNVLSLAVLECASDKMLSRLLNMSFNSCWELLTVVTCQSVGSPKLCASWVQRKAVFCTL